MERLLPSFSSDQAPVPRIPLPASPRTPHRQGDNSNIRFGASSDGAAQNYWIIPAIMDLGQKLYDHDLFMLLPMMFFDGYLKVNVVYGLFWHKEERNLSYPF